ncbi:MAG: polysaccharide deacetylase family protein [Acidobacteriota bacterium]|nr:MAG: polysaccharide deacetylase family protein [Acidobacteriota bacterium]
MKRTVARAFARRFLRNVLLPRSGNLATIFMLHRFSDPEHGGPGHAPEFVRQAIAWLRRAGFELISLRRLTRALSGEGRPIRHGVVFTIDDGYLDHATIAAPLFRELSCSVTIFPVASFLDGDVMLWWDQIEHLFRHTERRAVTLSLGTEETSYRWQTDTERDACQHALTWKLKDVPDEVRRSSIEQLAASLQVDLPRQPRRPYLPMSWEQARSLEDSLVSFGPHSLTHPILSRLDDGRARDEIEGSWRRLQSELVDPVPVFCFPNGRRQDFDDRAMRLVADCGLWGALSTEHDHVEDAPLDADPLARFRLPRFGFPNNMTDLIQIVTGVERFKQQLLGG